MGEDANYSVNSMTGIPDCVSDDVTITEVPAVKKTRARKPKAEKRANPAANLIAALKFISIAQKKVGTVGQQFCLISNNWLVASNEILTVGTKIEEDLRACPHTIQLLEALSNCEDGLQIAQLSPTALAVTSGAFKALVPCVGMDAVSIPWPDPVCGSLNNKIKEALEAVCCLAVEGAEQAFKAAVLLQAQSAISTNGYAMLEAWHGIDLPPGLLLPKCAAQAIAKCNKDLAGFGFSNSSATFYFSDESFIKTQLFAEQYPNYKLILDKTLPKAFNLPTEFFKAVKAIEAFSENGILYFNNGHILSKDFSHEASTYKIDGLPNGMAFNAKYLLMLQHAIKKAVFIAESKMIYFFNGEIRGCLMGVDWKQKAETTNTSDFDDDIPF